MIRKTDLSTFGAPAKAAPQASANPKPAPVASSRPAQFRDSFEVSAPVGVGSASRVDLKPGTEEKLAELEMLRALMRGDATGAQEAREAMLAFRAQRQS